jgi:hypothetical protein
MEKIKNEIEQILKNENYNYEVVGEKFIIKDCKAVAEIDLSGDFRYYTITCTKGKRVRVTQKRLNTLLSLMGRNYYNSRLSFEVEDRDYIVIKIRKNIFKEDIVEQLVKNTCYLDAIFTEIQDAIDSIS